MSMLSKRDSQFRLSELAREIQDSDMCIELRESATQLVMGEGDADADVVIIGEAPGKKEDELGRPFVGASGKLLDELLASIGLDRDAVYITNIIKYRPPNNRDPKPSEKQAFLPYLLKQLAIIEPKLIITLGRHSMEYFLPEAKIGDVHGHVMRKSMVRANGKSGEWLIMPLYHPAAALYNGSLRETLFNDFRKVGRFL